MTAEYKELRQRAEAAYNHLKDAASDKAAADGIIQNAHGVMDDFDASRNPRSIEDHIKQIVQALKDISHAGTSAMPADRAVAMTQMFEDLQMQVRQLPHY